MNETNGSAPIGIGLLGLGVVGSAVAASVLSNDGQKRGLKLCGALVRDASRQRAVELPSGSVTTDPDIILDSPDIDIVVELMGGEEPALEYISRALAGGKHVVTANKEVISKHGERLRALATEHNVSLQYEASVGGGIPIINPLLDDLSANELLSLRAIINGTTNYILTEMASGGASFDDALADAQGLGFAEADPTADVDAFDAVYKISILARLAFGVSVPVESIYREGIRKTASQDFRYAGELGYTIKLLAIARRENGGLLVRVHPALVPVDVPMAKVEGVLNVVEAEGDLVGPLWLQGRGAGAEPTASAVMGDVLRTASVIGGTGNVRQARPIDSELPLLEMDEHQCKFYVRLTVRDRPGVLAQIAGALGEMEISIASVLQMDTDAELKNADLVIMTHPAREANMQRAVERIDALGDVDNVANLIRVESYPTDR
ncbi:MAG: homoserine dehydrogenase [Chloroflexi bacterium]|nr:homoserine dehydrogenase [Chloroflexota bacterium]MBT4513666.1 homoserine dehydrogenase [Chloroflexota bacterium]MBT6680663.1 homoserine dehydrogenase [Chloroflexota bacterium]